MSLSYKLLRVASALVFVIAICLFLHSLCFITPARELPVTDKEHQIIGEVWIPYDSRGDLQMFGYCILLSGLQTWAVFALGKQYAKRDA